MIVNSERKTGFGAVGKVKVFDLNDSNRLFYSRDFKESGMFNLPAGRWLIMGRVTKHRFHYLDRPSLPKPERGHKMKCSKIVITDNPNKASTDPKTGLIILDKKISKKPRAELLFILLHEKGHTFYKSEYKCDFYAASKMLDLGYNPSQIAMAAYNTLGVNSGDRVLKIFNFGSKSRFQ